VPVCTAAAVLLFIGAGWYCLSLCLLAAGAAFHRGDPQVRTALLALGGLSLVSGGNGGSVALVTAASLSGLWVSDSPVSRTAFAACVMTALPEGSVENLVPLLPSAALAIPLRRTWQRGGLIMAGMASVMLLGGIPGASSPNEARAVENAGTAATSWYHSVPLDLSSPVLLLERGEDGAGILRIRCSAGGVRDAGTVAAVLSGGEEVLIDMGTDTLELAAPEFPVRIEIVRDWRPFNHPVVHFLGAEVLNADD